VSQPIRWEVCPPGSSRRRAREECPGRASRPPARGQRLIHFGRCGARRAARRSAHYRLHPPDDRRVCLAPHTARERRTRGSLPAVARRGGPSSSPMPRRRVAGPHRTGVGRDVARDSAGRRGVVWRAGWLHGQQSRPKRAVRRRATHATRYRTNGDEIDCGASSPTRPLLRPPRRLLTRSKKGPTMPSRQERRKHARSAQKPGTVSHHAQRRITRRVRQIMARSRSAGGTAGRGGPAARVR
jgi:hypothetical protein